MTPELIILCGLVLWIAVLNYDLIRLRQLVKDTLEADLLSRWIEDKNRTTRLNKLAQDVVNLGNKHYRATKVAEKYAERAFTLASSANIGIATLAKTLQTRPRVASKQQMISNEAFKRKLGTMDVFAEMDPYEYLRPTLSDDENDALDNILANQRKALNGADK